MLNRFLFICAEIPARLLIWEGGSPVPLPLSQSKNVVAWLSCILISTRVQLYHSTAATLSIDPKRLLVISNCQQPMSNPFLAACYCNVGDLYFYQEHTSAIPTHDIVADRMVTYIDKSNMQVRLQHKRICLFSA